MKLLLFVSGEAWDEAERMRRRKYGGVTTTVEQAMIDPVQTFEVTEVGMHERR